jgi:hypothetical protein
MKLISGHGSSILTEKTRRNPDLLVTLVPRLTQNLLSRLWSLELRAGSGVPNEFADRFDSILSGDTLAHQLARVILTSRLRQLFQLDQRWVVAKVIPLMHIGSKEDWSSPEGSV